MTKVLIVQAQEDAKYEPSKKGKGFKEAECLIILRDAASNDEFVATLHGSNAVREFPVGEIVMAKLKARTRKGIDGSYTQLLDVTSIKVMKRDVKESKTSNIIYPWEV